MNNRDFQEVMGRYVDLERLYKKAKEDMEVAFEKNMAWSERQRVIKEIKKFLESITTSSTSTTAEYAIGTLIQKLEKDEL